MIDLHCHLLPGIDYGATDISVSIAMAKAFVADGVTVVACTPHILPGVYANSGPQIRTATAALQQTLDEVGIPLRLITGADNHITPTFVAELSSGHLLSLADLQYVLVEPPHHVAPPRMEDLFFSLLVAGYVPDPDPSGAAQLDRISLYDDRAVGRRRRVDADHRRLTGRGVRTKSKILE